MTDNLRPTTPNIYYMVLETTFSYKSFVVPTTITCIWSVKHIKYSIVCIIPLTFWQENKNQIYIETNKSAFQTFGPTYWVLIIYWCKGPRNNINHTIVKIHIGVKKDWVCQIWLWSLQKWNNYNLNKIWDSRYILYTGCF